MSEQTIDRLARAVATRGSRRSLLAGMVGAAATTFLNRMPAGAQQCESDSQCPDPFTCQAGFCEAPGCTLNGDICSSNDDCCETSICQSGICGVSARCGREDELCGNGCCPGLVCAGGYCVVETPAPPENSGGGNGSSGGGGGSTGGGSGSGGSTGSSGTTTGGVAVASLPSTGTGTQADRAWSTTLIALASAVGLGSIASRVRSQAE